MHVTHADFSAASAVARPSRIEAFIASHSFDKPTLVLDIDQVEAQYHALAAGLDTADIHYAVKANPTREIIERLVKIGSHFDAASRGEIELCLSLGAAPETISFGNTVKRASDIVFAYQAGIRIFAADAEEELEKIDELLKQLEEAAKTAQIGLIDMEMMSEFAQPGDMQQLEEMRRQVENLLRETAERQGLESKGDGKGFRLTPQAYKIFQGRLLERIFSELQPSRSGRHEGDVIGEGAVELQQTKPYEFGDSVANMDIPQTIINALLRSGDERPLRLRGDDIVVHKTRNHPKCATSVIMDMSGSMRYDGQYINVKRMALALQGLIQSEYPGDFLRFIEMYTFAKLRSPSEIIELMPKPVTIHDPWVQLKADMSNDEISEHEIHPHFTNIQHSLQLARQSMVHCDTPNKQIVLITDGLPTAHFEESMLYLLYPPHPRTEQATMREAMLCKREGITINIFLIPSWSQSEEDIQFAYRLARTTQGRVFFSSGRDLDRFVVWDYVQNRRDIIR